MVEEKKNTLKNKKENKMREIIIEKMILSGRGIGGELDKLSKLFYNITNKKAYKTKARKRIPTFEIRPGLEIGCMVTLRGKEITPLLKTLLVTIDNRLKKKQIKDNHFSFGIKEYIEIPGVKYDREIGIIGFEVTVVFKRKGKRIKMKKIKKGKYPSIQDVSAEEIIKFLTEKFNVEVIGK